MWNWRAGECLKVLEGHTDGVVSLNYNGYLLASGSADSTIQIWNFRTGGKFTLRGHEDWVNSVLIWDGKSNPGDMDPTVMPSFMASSRSSSSSSAKPGSQPSFPNFNSSSSIPSLTRTNTASIQELDTDGQPKVSLPDIEPGTMLFSGSDDTTVKLWDLCTQTCLRTFTGHIGQIQSLKLFMVDVNDDELVSKERKRPRERETSPLASTLTNAGSSSNGNGNGNGRLSSLFAPATQSPPGGSAVLTPHFGTTAISPSPTPFTSLPSAMPTASSAAASNTTPTASTTAPTAASTFDPYSLRVRSRTEPLLPRVYVHSDEDEHRNDIPSSSTLGAASGNGNGNAKGNGNGNGNSNGHHEEVGKRAVLVSGALDGTIKLWDVESGREKGTLFGYVVAVIPAIYILSCPHSCLGGSGNPSSPSFDVSNRILYNTWFESHSSRYPLLAVSSSRIFWGNRGHP